MAKVVRVVNGIGFKVPEDEGKIIDFIKEHVATFIQSAEEAELYQQMLEHTAKEYDLEDFFAEYECDLTEEKGNGAVIANIMTRETGIRFEYYEGYSDPAVMFTKCYPWECSDKERALTEKDLHQIIDEYAQELSINHEDVMPQMAVFY